MENYRMGRLLGEGGYGAVYSAEELATGRPVAIKLVAAGDAEARRVLQREVRNHCELGNHPNIVEYLDVFAAESSLAIVMELADGGDLFDFVSRKRRLGEQEAQRFFRQLLDGTLFCHDRGVANRDIKLDNVLLSSDEKTLKICDFGLSKNVDLQSAAKTTLGTPGYMAPEMMLRGGEYDAKLCDVYSLGVMLYIMLCGKFPFGRPDLNPVAYIKAAVKGLPQAPQHVSKPCQDLLLKLLTATPEKRITPTELATHPWVTLELEREGGGDAALVQKSAQSSTGDMQEKLDRIEAVMSQMTSELTARPLLGRKA